MNRRDFFKTGVGAFVGASAIPRSAPASTAESSGTEMFASDSTSPLLIWYRQPAQQWEEALPVGNGRLGAMVFGGAPQEQLSLSELTLWSGAPSNQHENPLANSSIQPVRKLLFEGKYAEAKPIILNNFLGLELNYGTNVPTVTGPYKNTNADWISTRLSLAPPTFGREFITIVKSWPAVRTE